jgi:hypothetical protein
MATKTINLITTEKGITEKLILELDKLNLKDDDVLLVTIKKDKIDSNLKGMIDTIRDNLTKLNLNNLIIFRVGNHEIDFSSIDLKTMNDYGWYKKDQLITNK